MPGPDFDAYLAQALRCARLRRLHTYVLQCARLRLRSSTLRALYTTRSSSSICSAPPRPLHAPPFCVFLTRRYLTATRPQRADLRLPNPCHQLLPSTWTSASNDDSGGPNSFGRPPLPSTVRAHGTILTSSTPTTTSLYSITPPALSPDAPRFTVNFDLAINKRAPTLPF